MKRLTTILVLLVMGTIVLPGCVSRAVKETVGLGRGAKGIYVPLSPASSSSGPNLRSYQCFELGKVTDNFGNKVPRELLSLLPQKFQEQLQERELPNHPGGKTLSVCVKILHYEEGGLTGLAFGHFEEVIARVELVDKSSGQLIGTANCIGRTKESVNKGVTTKAEGLAKAITSWLAKCSSAS